MTARTAFALVVLPLLLAACGNDNERALQGWVEAEIVLSAPTSKAASRR